MGCRRGRKMAKKNSPWTDEELAILRDHYRTDGAKKCAKLLPGRTVVAIRTRAEKIGLGRHQTGGSPWTEVESQMLEVAFRTEGTACIHRFPERTRNSVLGRAYHMGLKNVPRWSEAEDAIIHEYYPSEGRACHTRLPGRTAAAVGERAIRLGVQYVSRKRRAWSDREDTIIREHYLVEGQAIISRLPGRTLDSVLKRANVIGVKRRPRKRKSA